MSIEVTLQSEGMQQVERMVNALSQLGSRVKAVELHTRKRKDGATNDTILEALKNTGRDFVSASPADAEKIAQAFVEEVERRLGQEFSKGAVVDVWNEKGSGRDLGKFSTELSSGAFMDAMKEYMRQVSERINEQRTNNPPFNSELNKDYAKKKMRDVGFILIGKYSGQLLENLNPGGTGASNIRLRK